MVELRGDAQLRIELDWEDAFGVSTPELAATWCAMSIWVDRRCLTGIEDSHRSFRKSVYTSAYPLAEWIAFNWWFLDSETRPSAVAADGWSWANVHRYDWLRRHNIRAAGNGMPWPNVTLVPEGAMTRIAWQSGPGLAGQPISFVTSGSLLVRSDAVTSELARFVDEVIDRLRDSDVGETPLSKEWKEIRDTDVEVAEFARAAARLGLDAYSIGEDQSLELLKLAKTLEGPLLDEFLDSAEPHYLNTALRWVERASARVEVLWKQPGNDTSLPLGIAEGGADLTGDPWQQGYDVAREVRRALDLEPTTRVNIDMLVPKVTSSGNSAGIQGYAAKKTAGESLALVLPTTGSTTAVRFAQARTLGLSLLGGERRRFILDPARTDLTKRTRAFAAELLAPAEGIAEMMSKVPAETDAAFDAIAKQFGASPLLIRHQYENQVLK